MGMYNTGKFRFDPDDTMTAKDLGNILRVLFDKHTFDKYTFDTDDMESLPPEARAHFTECLPDEFE
jgi:hypothetical protein